MAGYAWTQEEEALVIWFASTGLTHITITRLLFQRGFLRTMLSIRNKITAIRKQDALGDASNRLKTDEVDKWIKRLQTQSDILHILKPTTKDQNIVNAVRISTSPQGQQADSELRRVRKLICCQFSRRDTRMHFPDMKIG